MREGLLVLKAEADLLAIHEIVDDPDLASAFLCRLVQRRNDLSHGVDTVGQLDARDEHENDAQDLLDGIWCSW